MVVLYRKGEHGTFSERGLSIEGPWQYSEHNKFQYSVEYADLGLVLGKGLTYEAAKSLYYALKETICEGWPIPEEWVALLLEESPECFTSWLSPEQHNWVLHPHEWLILEARIDSEPRLWGDNPEAFKMVDEIREQLSSLSK